MICASVPIGEQKPDMWISFPFWDQRGRRGRILENMIIRINLENGLIIFGEGQSPRQHHSTDFHSVFSRVKKYIPQRSLYREIRAEYISVILLGECGIEIELARFSDPKGAINDWCDHVKARELRQLLATHLNGAPDRENKAAPCFPDIPATKLRDLGVLDGESLKELSKEVHEKFEQTQFGSKSLAFLGCSFFSIPLWLTISNGSIPKIEYFLMFGFIGLLIATGILIGIAGDRMHAYLQQITKRK